MKSPKELAVEAVRQSEDEFYSPFIRLDTLIQEIIEPIEGTREEWAKDAWALSKALYLRAADLQHRCEAQGAELGALREELGRADAVHVEQMREAERRVLEDDGADMTPGHRALLKKAQAYLKENPGE